MAGLPQSYNFTTGSSALPDVGLLQYNGCTFSPYFASDVSGVQVKSGDGRTVKWFEVTLTADGYVTAPAGTLSTSPTMVTMARLLSAQGGVLLYKGRGFDMAVNANGSLDFNGPSGQTLLTSDVSWGPSPELLEFQPLGGGLSAKVKWQVQVRVPIQQGSFGSKVLLQFTTETSVSYGEDGYSALSVRGVMEVPITRTPLSSRVSTYTVDNYRSQLEQRVMRGIDLSRFRVTQRGFQVSKDKRELAFDFKVEERPYMDLPADCTVARGSYNVRPARAGMGLVTWLCTLRATYTVRRDRPRRTAWDAFLLLLRERMAASEIGGLGLPNMAGGNAAADQNPGFLASLARAAQVVLNGVISPVNGNLLNYLNLLRAQNARVQASSRSWLIDFSFDEGIYLDSKTVSFSATWRLTTTFAYILQASGLWKKVAEQDARGNNLWAASMSTVQGSQSWLVNQLDPSLDVVVDFGGG